MNSSKISELLDVDRQHIWHPYSSFTNPPPVYLAEAASGCHIHLADGRSVIDGMASWWSVIHGYNHPEINAAAHQQLGAMSHVMFGGLTHEPAIELARLLIEMTPPSLDKIFFSDSGSVAVEVAMKMAIQYWHSQDQPEKCRFLALKKGYHGDTFGAMSVCDPVTGMHHLFEKALPKQIFAEAPPLGYDTPVDAVYLQQLERLFEQNHQQLCAVILEPVVQGAGGMRIYNPEYLNAIRQLCDQYQVLLIADEIATGFARTGELFACNHAGISPDILCLGKALTGGYLSLAATLCNARVSEGICSGEAGVFMHGPTFMANPLASRIALTSTRLLHSSDWRHNILRMQNRLTEGLEPCRELPQVEDVRVLGGIGVVELKQPVQMAAVQRSCLELGIWLRPFGKLVYIMPPYIMTDELLDTLTAGVTQVVRQTR